MWEPVCGTVQVPTCAPTPVGRCPALNAIRQWPLWAIPASARRFMLAIEAIAVALTVLALLTRSAPAAEISSAGLLRALTLVLLAIGYAEASTRVERLSRYLGSNKAFSNQSSVWTFAAVLCLPPGWASLVVVVIYLHVLVQRHREKSGLPYRVVFTAATVMISALAGGSVLNAVDQGALHTGIRTTVAVVLAMLVCNFLNCGLVLLGVWLTLRPPSLRSILPSAAALGHELAALVLGVVTAGFLLALPLLTPVVLILVAMLRRSGLVGELRRSAHTDAKTGLLNLGAWTEHANGVLSRSNRDHQPVTVLFCDLDAFKAVNDTHGHLVGDRVLVAVADTLHRELRGHDGLGRYGGEEFIVILDRLDPQEAHAVAERLRHAVGALPLDGIRISMSIGLAHHPHEDGHVELQQLLQRADTALYAAKNAGRNRVHCA